MVKCLECGKEMKRVSNTHLLKCGKITMAEYAIKYNKDIRELVDDDVVECTRLSNIGNGIGNKIREKKELNQLHIEDLTYDEKQILFGTLLGDSYLYNKHTKQPTSYLIMEHGIRQIDYLLWKASKLNRLGCRFHQKIYYSKIALRYVTRNWVTTDKTCSYMMGDLLKKWYTPKKIVCEEALHELGALGLAVWYMDDGSYHASAGCTLATQSFSYEDNIKIINYFKEKFDIDAKILQVKETHYIRFTKDGQKKLFKLIKPHILEKFKYKIGEQMLPDCIVAKEFTFNAAHYLDDYDGKCNREHGGQWVLWVYIKDSINPDTGMVIDYGYLKTVVNDILIKNLDHFHLNYVAPELRWRSTTEILSMYFWKLLIEFFPNLHKLQLYETPSSMCEFQGPTLDEFKFNKNNPMVKLLNSFSFNDLLKDRIHLNLNELFDMDPDGICAKVDSKGGDDDGR